MRINKSNFASDYFAHECVAQLWLSKNHSSALIPITVWFKFCSQMKNSEAIAPQSSFPPGSYLQVGKKKNSGRGLQIGHSLVLIKH